MTKSPPTVYLQLPTVLEPVAGRTRLSVRGHTVAEALEAAFAEVPVLRHHLTLDSGQLRPHVLCLVNEVTVERGKIDGVELSEGDEVMIHQAISGG